ncbi:hypothetical protein VTO73DRAFT_13071 [Trametes versicolor]
MTGLSAASSLLLSTRTGVDVLRRFTNAKFSMPQSCSVSGYNAMDNNKGQDPCQVAWALLPPCFAPTIDPENPPDLDEMFNNVCLPSRWPQYSSTFKLECIPSDVTSYAQSVPPDTSIPLWAFNLLGADGKVNIQQLAQSSTIPATTRAGGPSSIPQSTATVSLSGPPTPSSSASAASSTAHVSSATIQDGDQGALSSSAVASTPVATPTRATTSMRTPAFIGASAGLSAAALVATVAAVLLFRRDRRLTRAAKQAQLTRSPSVDLSRYVSKGLRHPGLAGADCTPQHDARDIALEPLRPGLQSQHAPNVRGTISLTSEGPDWPICLASQAPYQPLFNQGGQDPCSIALVLLKTCNTHLIQEYTRVSDIWEQLQNSPCACNTVWYSLFHVCTQCAGSELQAMSWLTFRGMLKCEAPANEAYTEHIPSDTAIPAWAYLPLADNNTVDFNQVTEAATGIKPDITSPGTYIPPPRTTTSPSTINNENAPGSTSTSTSMKGALPRPLFIGTSAGLSVAAFITTVIAILLFRRDRRLTRAANQARLERSNSICDEGASSLLAFTQGTRVYAARRSFGTRVSQVPLRPQRLAPEVRETPTHGDTTYRPTPGTFDGGVWRA